MTGDQSRLRGKALADKVMPAEDAATFIAPGDNVGMSGFTGSGHPKAVPAALVVRITEAAERGDRFTVGVWTGSSTAPQLDGALAAAGGIDLRMPYQSDPVTRAKINAGLLDYVDVHLSHVAQMVAEGVFGHLDVALIEVAGITADGALIPSSSVGSNNTWIDLADRVILEVNSWQPAELEGMHDVYYGSALPPHRTPIRILTPSDRIGGPYLHCPPEKIIAVVPTHEPDYSAPSRPADEDSRLIAGHVLDFLTHEVRRGRLPATLLPLQSGVGNITNAVLGGLADGAFPPLTAYTEVVQDGMLQLLRSGAMTVASATGFSLSQDGLADLHAGIADYRHQIILRPQEISNHPEVIRRLGCLAMNGMIEADIYGNVNSTHIMGSSMQNGIGGSGDFTRNAYLVHRADGQPRRPHRARRACHHHRAGRRRPARLAAAAPGPADHRPLRAPRLPAGPAGLPRPGDCHRTWQAHPAPARRGIVVARKVPARRQHAAALKHDRERSLARKPGSAASVLLLCRFVRFCG